jgi:hypothetical protein
MPVYLLPSVSRPTLRPRCSGLSSGLERARGPKAEGGGGRDGSHLPLEVPSYSELMSEHGNQLFELDYVCLPGCRWHLPERWAHTSWQP